ncbi:MAG: U32 family peptidase [Actinobacteria bacterium]|nr:U32 family peptidase [Actinomycetota bacterium]
MEKNIKNQERPYYKVPELCVPAGNLRTLKYAAAYGADAVYVGGGQYNLRSFGNNFTVPELKEAVNYAHSKKIKVYLALNAIIGESELNGAREYVESIRETDFDAIIISDPGMFGIVKKMMPGMRLHISTQASISNSMAVNLWSGLGASRVNVARELAYGELCLLKKNSKTEIEVFVHGALCISYSGRCMLSKYLSGRDANKGQCSHTCRWKYYLMEEKRPNMFLPADMDKRGTYIYNSRDLCLLEKLDLIADIGVDAVKIEGRMKTENYVAQVTWVYRKALDCIKKGGFSDYNKKFLMAELDKTTHRSFTEGFMFLNDRQAPELTDNDNVGYTRKYRFAGSVNSLSSKYNKTVITARNQVKVGDMLDVLQPGKENLEFRVLKITRADTGENITVANTNELIIINGLENIDEFALLRKKE